MGVLQVAQMEADLLVDLLVVDLLVALEVVRPAEHQGEDLGVGVHVVENSFK